METLTTLIGGLLLLSWLGLCLWSWLSPAPPEKSCPEQAERDRQIGLMIGSLGGSIEQAAQARYAISRLEENLGRRATLHEIATAIGVTISS